MSTLLSQLLSRLKLAENTLAIAVMDQPLGFSDAMLCRSQVKAMHDTVSVIVFNRTSNTVITPINMAAALSLDCPARDVYLWEDQPSVSLVSHARVAGIRGVINCNQLEQMLLPSLESVTDEVPDIPDNADCASANASASSTDNAPSASDTNLSDTNPSANASASDTNLSDTNPSANASASDTNLSDTNASADNIPLWDLELLDLDEPVDRIPRKPSIKAADTTTDLSGASHDVAGINQLHPDPVSQPDSARHASIVGVFSGRGGVGKSTVSLLLSFLARQQGLKVALVDADLQFGDIGYLVGHAAKTSVNVMPLLTAAHSLANLSPEATLTVLTAPENVEQSELLAEKLPQIISDVARQVDLVLVNTSAFWTSTQAEMARVCSRLLFLMDQRTTSIKACQRVVDLCIKLQIPEARFSYAINGCHRFAPITTLDASLALGGSEVVGLNDGGTIVDELLSLGCPEELIESDNAFVRSLQTLLAHLLPYAFSEGAVTDAHPEASFGISALLGWLKRGTRDVA